MLLFIAVTQLLIMGMLWYLLKASLDLSKGFAVENSRQLSELAATGKRIEDNAAEVAQDLSNAHARADAVEFGNHGAAADAASAQTPREKIANHNPHGE